jgi:hypothetical protein
MHVFYAAEVAVEGGGEDDDWDVWTIAAQESGDFSTELAGAEMVVKDRDIDVVEKFGGFFNGGCGDALITVLPEDGGAKVEICRLVIEQEDAYGGDTVGHTTAGVGRLDHDGSKMLRDWWKSLLEVAILMRI